MRARGLALVSRLGAAAAVAAALAGPCLAQQPDAVSRIAAENARLSAQIADGAKSLDRALADLAQLRKSKDELEKNLQRIERHAKVPVLGREFAETAIEQVRLLPRTQRLAAARAERDRALAATSDASLRVERTLARLGDLDAAVAARLAAGEPPVPQAERPQVEAALRSALGAQRDLATRLAELQEKLVQALREVGEAERDLERHSEAARAKLTQLILWIPAPPGTQMVSALAPAIAWTVSPANWRAAAAVLREELLRRPFWPALVLLAAATLYALRGRLQRALVSLAPAAVGYERYRIGHALAAFAITFALAAPVPAAIWTAAVMLGAAPDSPLFAQALGEAFALVASLLLALSALTWLLDRRGMAIGHFGWDEAATGFVARALRRLTVLLVPLIFVTALNSVPLAPHDNRESLGRLAFNLAMIAVAVVLVILLRRRSPLMQRLSDRAPRAWPVRLHGLWRGALLAPPLGIAVLAAAGYFGAAGYFFRLTVQSLYVVLGALTLYGLIALWVQVQRSHLARRSDAEAPGRAPADAATNAARLPQRLDVAALGEQTRSLLQLLITLVLVGGVWWVWKDALPALSVIGDYALWTYTETVDGKPVTRPLTVGGLFLALVVGAVTAVAVRNIGALLDIVLLQRLDVKPDATYAIKVVAQYALAAAGIVVASDILGIGWSDVQWLIAALGVGLGFGLQEIFANLVSGLIILGERPIRIGDVVTVGDVTGTVARIRARATVIVDSENKEILIPNKSFITDRVINWTLTNQTTRLAIKVSVGPRNDIEAVRQLILEVVRRNADVLREPPPSVSVAAFGGSSLDFEIQASVDSFDKRSRVKDEINVGVARALREHGI